MLHPVWIKANRSFSNYQSGNDRIGIVAYAGNAFPVLPITSDYGASMFLQSMNTDIIFSRNVT
jgi:Ca-activated chloride channel family protein